ncbi:MAG TPA: alpha/beta fold hydrolase [Acidimicrobiales bacterium]|nr:alpha/beta fold hydrolase [Acidimicrobiales bacterium]
MTEDSLTEKARTRNFSPWHAWMVALGRTEQVDPFPSDGDADAVLAWRGRCRQRLHELLGRLPERVPLQLETIEQVECEGYRRQLVVFDTEDTMSVPAYLLVPHERNAPGPAVLAVHGHGPGKGLVVGLDSTEAPNGDYAHQLARRGYVVLAPDLRCFGQRQDWNPPDHYACDTNLVHAAMAGWNPLTQNLWDMARALDVLEAHELVDPARIAVAGLSYGGTIALFLAAWDERVSAAVVSGYFSSWAEAHKMPWNMCGSQILPGMLGQLEHVDLGALVAPRPLLVESGDKDDLFPAAVARAEIEKLRRVYRALGATDEVLVHDVFSGGHQWHGDEAYAFLARFL